MISLAFPFSLRALLVEFARHSIVCSHCNIYPAFTDHGLTHLIDHARTTLLLHLALALLH